MIDLQRVGTDLVESIPDTPSSLEDLRERITRRRRRLVTTGAVGLVLVAVGIGIPIVRGLNPVGRQVHAVGRPNTPAPPLPVVTRPTGTVQPTPAAVGPVTVPEPGALLSTDGTVGQFRLQQSRRSDLVAALGAPGATARGKAGAFKVRDFTALGYQCSDGASAGGGSMSNPAAVAGGYQPAAPSPPYCLVIYFLDSTRGVLMGFWTASPAFATAVGTRVGMTAAQARTREGIPVSIGCHQGILETRGGGPTFVHITIPARSYPVPSDTDTVRSLTADAGLGLLEC